MIVLTCQLVLLLGMWDMNLNWFRDGPEPSHLWPRWALERLERHLAGFPGSSEALLSEQGVCGCNSRTSRAFTCCHERRHLKSALTLERNRHQKKCRETESLIKSLSKPFISRIF